MNKEQKQQSRDWLINNLQLANKSHVELIISHVEHYFTPPSAALPVWPTDKDIAVELIARYNGGSRGNPIAKKAFIDAIEWVKTFSPVLPVRGEETDWVERYYQLRVEYNMVNSIKRLVKEVQATTPAVAAESKEWFTAEKINKLIDLADKAMLAMDIPKNRSLEDNYQFKNWQENYGAYNKLRTEFLITLNK